MIGSCLDTYLGSWLARLALGRLGLVICWLFVILAGSMLSIDWAALGSVLLGFDRLLFGSGLALG